MIQIRVDWMIADEMPKGFVRGKSGLRRAGCRVIPGEGDFKESATEIDRRTGVSGSVRMER